MANTNNTTKDEDQRQQLFTAEDVEEFEHRERITAAENLTDEEALIALCGYRHFNANLTPSTHIAILNVLQGLITLTPEEDEMMDCLITVQGYGEDIDKLKRVISRAMKYEGLREDAFSLICSWRLFWNNLSKETQEKIIDTLEAMKHTEKGYMYYDYEGIQRLEQRFFKMGYLSRTALEKLLQRYVQREFKWY